MSLDAHALSFCGQEIAEDVGAMSGACAAVLHAWNVFHIVVVDSWGVFLEWKEGLDFIQVFHLLELFLVRVNLLLEVLNSLSNTLGNFEIMLNFFHGCSRLCLNHSILG